MNEVLIKGSFMLMVYQAVLIGVVMDKDLAITILGTCLLFS